MLLLMILFVIKYVILTTIEQFDRPDQKLLIKDTDFVNGKNDDTGKITVTIKNHGNDKPLTSGAFRTNQNVVNNVLAGFT